jgi:hypothetical protein
MVTISYNGLDRGFDVGFRGRKAIAGFCCETGRGKKHLMMICRILKDDSFGLFIAGVILFAVGLLLSWRAAIEAEKNALVTEPSVPSQPESTQSVAGKYCRFCGAKNKSDAIFCEGTLLV